MIDGTSEMTWEEERLRVVKIRICVQLNVNIETLVADAAFILHATN